MRDTNKLKSNQNNSSLSAIQTICSNYIYSRLNRVVRNLRRFNQQKAVLIVGNKRYFLNDNFIATKVLEMDPGQFSKKFKGAK